MVRLAAAGLPTRKWYLLVSEKATGRCLLCGCTRIIRILAELDVVAAKPGQVLDQNDIDPFGFRVSDQPLDTGPLEIRARKPIVDVHVNQIPAPLTNVPLEQEFLRGTL